ncbi:MAG: DUF4405 domain-containing protein [Candidatus Brocadiia bacterium]
MSKNKLNLLVDVLAYLAMACLAATGLIMLYRLPPGTGGRHSGEPALTLLGLGRHDWGNIHFYIALGLLGLVVLHIVLHWKWVTNTFGSLVRRAGARRPGAGPGGAALLVILAVVTLLLLAAPWLLPLQKQEAATGGKGRAGAQDEGPRRRSERRSESQGERDEDHEERIARDATVAEAADYAGVSTQRLLEALGWPPETPVDRTLDQCRPRGQRMRDVKDAVERLRRGSPQP